MQVRPRKRRTASGWRSQNLLDQIVDDIAIVPRKGGDEAGRVTTSLDRQRGQLQSCDPPFRALRERRNLAGRKFQVQRVIEIGGGLSLREAKVGGSDFDHLAASPQSRQRQGRIGTRADRKMDVGRQPLEQERQAVVDLLPLDDMVVVEHQIDVGSCLTEFVEQGGEKGLQGTWT